MTKPVIHTLGPEALQREGLREAPEAWEDGQRAKTDPGFFEWWYFDAQFEDGSTAVIVFLTKPLLDRKGPLKPVVQVTITRPDGKRISQSAEVPSEAFSASKERCYVRTGESWVRDDSHCYELHAKTDDLAAHLTFTSQVPAWRPGAGKIYYDEAMTQYFAWLAAIPFGKVEGRLTYDGKIRTVKGTCYHDHNWGNIGLNQVMSHWYWGRAQLGDLSMIFVEMTTSTDYGSKKIPVFMLAKGDQVLINDGQPLRMLPGQFSPHSGGREYPLTLNYTWQKENDWVHISLKNPTLIEAASLLNYLPTWKRLPARLMGNPYYFRFKSDLELELEFGSLRTLEKGSALYEIMLLR
jgi:predicted secreted hydrolase